MEKGIYISKVLDIITGLISRKRSWFRGIFSWSSLHMTCYGYVILAFWKESCFMEANELFIVLSYFRFDKELNKEVAIKVIDLEES